MHGIQFVSRATGINAHTIRAWENRYNAITPKRDKNKRRFYTEDDIIRLQKIKKLNDYGNSISVLATMSEPELDEMLKYIPPEVPKREVEELDKEGVQKILARAVIGYNEGMDDMVKHEIGKAFQRLSPERFVDELLLPLLLEVKGRKVEVKIYEAI